MRILLATSLYSPFQVELARELNRIPGIEFHIAFTLPQRSARGAHWREAVHDDMRHRVEVIADAPNDHAVTKWVRDQIDRRLPDVVISGAMGGPIHTAVDAPRHRRDYVLGYWNEPPNFQKRGPYVLVRKLGFAQRLQHADFVLAIGDRAQRYYGSIVPNTALVPYGEDLSACFDAVRLPDPDGRLRFLYSGQLIPRQNIDVIMESARRVLTSRGPRFTLTLAASGPEQALVDKSLGRTPGLRDVVRYDRDYSSWMDRLRPFAEADVLLYPSAHAGWGLVIPEAMAAGCIPITTRYVEAARTLVREGETGFFVAPIADDVTIAMERLIDAPETLTAMRAPARASARFGHAPDVAGSFVRAVRGFAKRMRPEALTER